MAKKKNGAKTPQVSVPGVETMETPDPEDLRPKGMSSLADAAWDGDIDVVKSLVEKGAKIEAVDAAGRTVLALAALSKHCDIVKFLLEQKAEIDAKDDAGITPLMWAARAGHVDEARALVEGGANVEAKDDDGMTATKLAALFNHAAVVQVLVEGGADPKPALEFARKFKQSADAVRYLLKVVLADHLPKEEVQGESKEDVDEKV